MTGIVLTAAMRANLLSLQTTQRLLDQTQLRLATGLKVNSALDNPTAFFAASALNNRASDLSGLLDSMGQGIQVLKAADQGIQSLTKLVEQAKSVAQSAKDQASGAAVSRSTDIVAADLPDLTGAGAVLSGSTGTTFTLQAGTSSPTVNFTITAGMSASDLVAQINGQTGFAAQLVAGSSTTLDTNRRIEIRTTNGEDLITTDGGALAALGFAGSTTVTATGTPPDDQVALEAQYTELLTQIDNLVEDTGYRGTNLLSGDSLDVQFNEDNTSSINIAGVDFDSAGLGLNAANFADEANIQTALDEIDAALDSLRSQASSFGNNLSIVEARQDFTENLVNLLTDGADQLTVADKNEEGANLLALQTTQQLGITSLSLASQANQSVLRLFG